MTEQRETLPPELKPAPARTNNAFNNAACEALSWALTACVIAKVAACALIGKDPKFKID